MLRCSGSWKRKDLLQKVTSLRTKEEGQASQREEGRAEVFMAHSGKCESFGMARFSEHIRAVKLEGSLGLARLTEEFISS